MSALTGRNPICKHTFKVCLKWGIVGSVSKLDLTNLRFVICSTSWRCKNSVYEENSAQHSFPPDWDATIQKLRRTFFRSPNRSPRDLNNTRFMFTSRTIIAWIVSHLQNNQNKLSLLQQQPMNKVIELSETTWYIYKKLKMKIFQCNRMMSGTSLIIYSNMYKRLMFPVTFSFSCLILSCNKQRKEKG